MNNLLTSDKNLLTEIKRINELISPQHNPKQFILLEQLGGLVDDLISKYSNNVAQIFGFTSKENYPSIIKSLKQIYGKKGGDVVIRDLDPATSVRELIDIFPKLTDSAKKKFVELIIKYSNERIDNVLETTVTSMLNITSADLKRLAKAYNTNEKAFFNAVFPPDTPEILKPFISRYWKKVNDIGDVLTTDDIAKFSDYVNKKGGTTFISDIGKAWNKTLDEILDQVKKLNVEYNRKVESGTYGADQMDELSNAYSVAVLRQMNMMEMKMKDGANKVLELSDLDNTLKNKILNGSEDIFVVFKKLRSGKDTKLLAKLYEMIDSITLKMSDTTIFGYKYPQLKASPEFRQYFVTGQWAFISDVYYKAVQKNLFSSPKQSLAYIGSLVKKSIWGSALAAVAMAALVTLWIEVRWKEGINWMYSKFGLPPKFPNPDEGRSECKSVLIAMGDTYLRLLCEYLNNGKLLIPVIGTIEVSPLGMIAKALMGKDEILFGYNDVDKEIEQNLENESGVDPTPPTPNDDIIDKFKQFIISDWKTDYKEGNVTFYKEGDYYVAEDKSVNMKYLYKYNNNNTFEFVP